MQMLSGLSTRLPKLLAMPTCHAHPKDVPMVFKKRHLCGLAYACPTCGRQVIVINPDLLK